jgi:aprataxin
VDAVYILLFYEIESIGAYRTFFYASKYSTIARCCSNMSSQLKILRTYAKLDDTSIAAKKLPPTVYFSHTPHTLTIFDAYPKALFHFLILPRLQTARSTAAAAASPTTLNDADEDKRERRGRGHDSDSDSGGGPSVSLVANSETVLTSLRTLLRSALPSSSSDDAKARARGTLRVLADEATRLRDEIEREMRARYGFSWPIWIGFHAVPSME